MHTYTHARARTPLLPTPPHIFFKSLSLLAQWEVLVSSEPQVLPDGPEY